MTVPPHNPFLDPTFSLFSINEAHKISHEDRLVIATFLQAYHDDPSQYSNKAPIDLIHEDLIPKLDKVLELAAQMGSIQFYQFILDTGHIGEGISNRQFIRHCFYQGETPSYTFTKYLLDLYPNRIDLIPPNILLALLVVDSRDVTMSPELLQLFWDYCPRLSGPDFLTYEIRMPDPNRHLELIKVASKCIDDGGYHGNLASWDLEDKYEVSFLEDHNDNGMFTINLLIVGASIPVIQSFIKNGNINLEPLYFSIDPESDSQDSLRSLDDIPRSIEKHFLLPIIHSYKVLSSESVLCYLNWWKNDVLGDVLSLHEFKTFLFGLLGKLIGQSPNTPPIAEYLGNDFFTTLSSDQVLSFFDNLITRPSKNTKTLLSALLSIPHVANIVKGHCVEFTRKSLLDFRFMWDCAELFLNFGGLTMEQIWSDDNNDGDDKEVFTLETIFPSCMCSNVDRTPLNFIEWLSDQPGTQKQLIKLVQSKQKEKCTDTVLVEHENLHQLFNFISLSYHIQIQQQRLNPEEEKEHLNLFPPSRPKKSLSWLQSFIVYAPIDYMNISFTTKLWDSDSRHIQKKNMPNISQPKLSHLPILINGGDSRPEFLLEDIIQGVIASLLINYQPEKNE